VAKVFVSHRRGDAGLAERLAEDLRASGHDVWFDEWAINLGDSIVGRINEGLHMASYLVLCCSASDVTAPWIGREWLSALARQLNHRQVRVLPVLLPGGAPPAILADLKYADLGTNWRDGVAELLRAIR
jgi:hypothetical protein